jgi:hypothetical protein
MWWSNESVGISMPPPRVLFLEWCCLSSSPRQSIPMTPKPSPACFRLPRHTGRYAPPVLRTGHQRSRRLTWQPPNRRQPTKKSTLSQTAIHSRRLLRLYQASAANPDANNTSVDGSGFATSLGVETEALAVLRARARPVEEGTVSERERGMVVVTVD